MSTDNVTITVSKKQLSVIHEALANSEVQSEFSKEQEVQRLCNMISDIEENGDYEVYDFTK